jgi:hypothetical protein
VRRFRLANIGSVDDEKRRAWTHDGEELDYDHLIVATGTRLLEGISGAVTFWGVADDKEVQEVVQGMRAANSRRVAFTMPAGRSWALPMYELALLAEHELAREDDREVSFVVVTPEESPLRLFGQRASSQVAELLAGRGIEVITGASPVRFDGGVLTTSPGEAVEADAVIALPRMEGRKVAGVPHDSEGFVAVDDHCRVQGMEHGFAVGDVTTFPVKQGGIAAQQADAAAAFARTPETNIGGLSSTTPIRFPSKLKLIDVTTFKLARFVDWLADEDEQGKRLSDSTIANIVIPVRAALSTANREGLIRHNPSLGLALPHREDVEEDEDEDEVKVFSREQLAAVLAMAPEHYKLLFAVRGAGDDRPADQRGHRAPAPPLSDRRLDSRGLRPARLSAGGSSRRRRSMASARCGCPTRSIRALRRKGSPRAGADLAEGALAEGQGSPSQGLVKARARCRWGNKWGNRPHGFQVISSDLVIAKTALESPPRIPAGLWGRPHNPKVAGSNPAPAMALWVTSPSRS